MSPADFDTTLSVSIETQDDQLTLVLAGELDIASAGEIDRLTRDTPFAGVQRVVLDLRDVEFIDSSGLRLLLGLRNDAKRNGSRLTVLAPAASEARRIFLVTGTRAVFDWADG